MLENWPRPLAGIGIGLYSSRGAFHLWIFAARRARRTRPVLAEDNRPRHPGHTRRLGRERYDAYKRQTRWLRAAG